MDQTAKDAGVSEHMPGSAGDIVANYADIAAKAVVHQISRRPDDAHFLAIHLLTRLSYYLLRHGQITLDPINQSRLNTSRAIFAPALPVARALCQTSVHQLELNPEAWLDVYADELKASDLMNACNVDSLLNVQRLSIFGRNQLFLEPYRSLLNEFHKQCGKEDVLRSL